MISPEQGIQISHSARPQRISCIPNVTNACRSSCSFTDSSKPVTKMVFLPAARSGRKRVSGRGIHVIAHMELRLTLLNYRILIHFAVPAYTLISTEGDARRRWADSEK
jgi:hypothetical protein